MKLFFLRHGPSGDRSGWKGNDTARPLTDEGVKIMKRMEPPGSIISIWNSISSLPARLCVPGKPLRSSPRS